MKESSTRTAGARRSAVAPGIATTLFSAALLLMLPSSAAAKQDPTASAELRGEAAVAHLQESGGYDSLAAAVTAARYRVETDESGARVMNDANGFQVSFAGNSWQLKATAQEKRWVSNWRLRSFGYGAEQTLAADGGWHSADNRVELRRDSQQITEWFVNSPQGVEHGFTLAARPGTHKAGEALRLVMELKGDLTPRADENGQLLTLLERNGAEALRYEKLKVWDARGTNLSARMRTQSGEVWLEVDDAAAVYPITIDPTFIQQQKLTASDGAAGDGLGSSMAMSGNTVIVGAYDDSTGPNADESQGSAYVFVRSGPAWTFQQKLTASDGAVFDRFGYSVGISGNTAIVGAHNADIGENGDQGAAYIFVRSGTTWTFQQKLTATSDGNRSDQFGRSVAISAETAIVGAYGNDIGENSNQGSAYIFVRNGTTWTEQQRLLASDGGQGDEFGHSVAISGYTAIIGAHRADIGGVSDQGAAYIFAGNGTSWREEQKLTASDGGLNDNFGRAVAISGDTVIVDAWPYGGLGYIFVRSGTGWTEQQKLLPIDGAIYNLFAKSVAISGDTAIVGAPHAGVDLVGSRSSAGTAYVFVRSGTTWTAQPKLTATDGASHDGFGFSVAISGNTAIVGAPGVDRPGGRNEGAVYVSPTLWLSIDVPEPSYEVGDNFAATITVTAAGSDPIAINFVDPLVRERPFSGVLSDAILTLESPPAPEPFELTPESRTRSFTVPVRVEKLGVTELVSSLSFQAGDGVNGTIEAKAKVSAPPFKVTVEVTPRQTLLNLTAAAKKSERCREIEQKNPTIQNCIEITAKVTNSSDHTISNVNIPDAASPLKLINETDPQVLGEPLTEIEHVFPGSPVTLPPGAEATWIWRMNAFDAPAALEFEPTAFGVVSGQEVGSHGNRKFKILKDVLLKWGMRPNEGRTAYKSGDNILTSGYIENVSAGEDGKGEGEHLLVHVYPLHEGNVGGGFVVPETYRGPVAKQEHFFDLPPKGDLKRAAIKSVFNSLRTGLPSTGKIGLGVRLWIVNDDGSLTDTDEQVELDEDYSDEYSITYSAEQIIQDPYVQDCLDAGVPPIFCGVSEAFYGDFLPGMVGLTKFGWEALHYFGEIQTRSMAIQTKREQLMLRSVLDNPEAKNALLQSLHGDYLELHQQGVLAGQVFGQAPQAFEEFSNETLDSLGRYLYAIEKGNLQEVALRTGQFLGSNPDLLLEPIKILRTLTKMREALAATKLGTADNIYAAAARADAQAEAATLPERIAAAKAKPGDPDLAKALLPGDRLTAKMILEIFGVDQETIARIQKIADDADVILAFRARSARAAQLLRDGLAWPKPQALKQKCVNRLDIDYLGYREDAYGMIEIVEPPSGLRGKEGPELQTALDEHMAKLEAAKPELAANAELRAEVRNRIETRAQEWTKYNPQLDLYNPDVGHVTANVNFEADAQWARDMMGDIGLKEERKIYRNDKGTRTDPATGEPVRTWEITMDGPNGKPPRRVTGDIDFLAMLDKFGNFINDDDKRIAIYKALQEAQVLEHGESMSLRFEKARQEYIECCLEGEGEGMMTIGPWVGGPRVGFFVDNRSVLQQHNAAFKRVRKTEIARDKAGEIIYENGRPKTIVIRMEDPSGEFPLINGIPILNNFDQAIVRRFAPTLWEAVWEDYLRDKIRTFFPNLLKDFIEDKNSPKTHSQYTRADSEHTGTDGTAQYRVGGPLVRFEPISVLELKAPDKLQMWSNAAGWTPATREEVLAAGEPGVVDFAPYSVLRENSAAGSNRLIIAPLTEMGATGDFFAAGDTIVLDPGGERQETAVIQSMNPLTLAAPLSVDHKVGEMIAVIGRDVTVPSPTPTASPTPVPTISPLPTATVSPTATPIATASPSPTATASPSPTPTPTPSVAPLQLLNISTRLNVQTGENVLIGGIIITGAEPKKVILRAIGPSLGAQSVEGALQDPMLELFDNAGEPIATNDNWKLDEQTEIEASTIPPSDDAEAAIVRILAPGNYTAVVSGKNASTGIGLIEVYDLAQSASSQIANISSRGFVEAGDNALIGGFIAGGSDGGTPARVVVRALGPSLADQGVTGALADPTLELIDANGSTVRANDDWKTSQQIELEALGIQPTHDAESALIATLPSGNYTAVVRGNGDTTGVGLVEVYNVP